MKHEEWKLQEFVQPSRARNLNTNWRKWGMKMAVKNSWNSSHTKRINVEVECAFGGAQFGENVCEIMQKLCMQNHQPASELKTRFSDALVIQNSVWVSASAAAKRAGSIKCICGWSIKAVECFGVPQKFYLHKSHFWGQQRITATMNHLGASQIYDAAITTTLFIMIVNIQETFPGETI